MHVPQSCQELLRAGAKLGSFGFRRRGLHTQQDVPGANPLRESFAVELTMRPVAAGKTSYELGEPVFVGIGLKNVGDRSVQVFLGAVVVLAYVGWRL